MEGTLNVSEAAMNDTVAKLNTLISDLEEIDIVSKKTEGDAGSVCDVIRKGETNMKDLIDAWKVLIESTAKFLEDTKNDLLDTDSAHDRNRVGVN